MVNFAVHLVVSFTVNFCCFLFFVLQLFSKINVVVNFGVKFAFNFVVSFPIDLAVNFAVNCVVKFYS